jgi:hypothetical protein
MTCCYHQKAIASNAAVGNDTSGVVWQRGDGWSLEQPSGGNACMHEDLLPKVLSSNEDKQLNTTQVESVTAGMGRQRGWLTGWQEMAAELGEIEGLVLGLLMMGRYFLMAA